MVSRRGLVNLRLASPARPVRWGLVGILVLACTAAPVYGPVYGAFGALAVFDAANFGQAVLEVAHTISIVQQGIRDLSQYVEVGEVIALAAEMQQLIVEIDGLVGHMQARLGVYRGQQTLPGTTSALAEFRWRMTNMCLQARLQALEAQTLIARMTRILTIVRGMLDTIQALVGTVSGMQAVSGHLGAMVGQLAVMQTMAAMNNESTLCEAWQVAIRQQAVRQIEVNLLRGFGEVRE